VSIYSAKEEEENVIQFERKICEKEEETRNQMNRKRKRKINPVAAIFLETILLSTLLL